MENEIWQPLPEYEKYIIVSNLGNVQSLNRKVVYSDGRVFFYKGKILKQFTTKDGYKLCSFSINSKHITFLIHRIVAFTFLPKCHINKKVINHLDGNRANNFYLNLQWCTQSENLLYTYNILNYRISDETRKKLSISAKIREHNKRVNKTKELSGI